MGHYDSNRRAREQNQEDDPPVGGRTVQASTSAVIGNRADAFGLIHWVSKELSNKFQMMVEQDIRVDVTIEFRETNDGGNDGH